MSKAAFLDTNVFLHYQPIDQINWLQVTGADTLTLVIAPVTIRELNKHKDTHPKTHIRERAAATLKKLSALFESGPEAQLRDSVEIYLELNVRSFFKQFSKFAHYYI